MELNKKGISLIVITVSLVIILTMISVVTFSLIENNNNAKKLEFSNELNMVQMAVDVYYNKNGRYPVEQSIVISNVDDIIKNEQFKKEKEGSSGFIFDIIDYEEAGILNLKYGNRKNGTDDIYVVSSLTGFVYYAKGLKIGNYVYYRIDDILSNTSDNEVYSNIGISFFEYDDGKVDIKIPKSYQEINVYADNVTVTTSKEVGEYIVYTCNIKSKPYTLMVKYKENNIAKETSYLVD